jgi:tetratricopeptide (TPR) repeat protein
MLFNQAIFVLDRPRSRLAREYRRLTRTLIAENPADREGALHFLHQYAQGYLPKVAQDVRAEVNRKLGVAEEASGVSADDPDLVFNDLARFDRDYHITSWEERDRLDRIAQNFLNDAEVLLQIAECRMLGYDFHEALDVLNRALVVQPYLAQALFDRAACHHRLGNTADAAADLMNYCQLGGLESRAVVSALRQLSAMAPEKVPEAVELPAVRGLPRGGILAVAEILAERDEGLPQAVQIVREYGGGSDAGRSLLFRYLMRLHRWREAIEILGKPPTNPFELAMAIWGETGELPEDLLRQALQREDEEYGHLEGYNPDSVVRCLVLWRAGQIAEAIQTLDRIVAKFKENPWQMVSYWTFRRVPPDQYLADCQQFRRMIQGEPIRPAFLGEPAAVGEPRGSKR